ncbi:WASH complex subunit 1-like [Anolis carolinensis]|uniref:WASH complex subunit 1-like n=1 Tax=Anolis carolinensis TaxID=28377 RepID=UPI002F2B5FED
MGARFACYSWPREQGGVAVDVCVCVLLRGGPRPRLLPPPPPPPGPPPSPGVAKTQSQSAILSRLWVSPERSLRCSRRQSVAPPPPARIPFSPRRSGDCEPRSSWEGSGEAAGKPGRILPPGTERGLSPLAPHAGPAGRELQKLPEKQRERGEKAREREEGGGGQREGTGSLQIIKRRWHGSRLSSPKEGGREAKGGKTKGDQGSWALVEEGKGRKRGEGTSPPRPGKKKRKKEVWHGFRSPLVGNFTPQSPKDFMLQDYILERRTKYTSSRIKDWNLKWGRLIDNVKGKGKYK